MSNNNQKKSQDSNAKLKEALKRHERLTETDEEYRKASEASREKAKKYFLYLTNDSK